MGTCQCGVRDLGWVLQPGATVAIEWYTAKAWKHCSSDRNAMSIRTDTTSWTLTFAAWFVALSSVLGALFFSEVMQLAPCELCWYQRMIMFSLAVVFTVGLFPFDGAVVRYALPLVAIGLLVAVFHQLLIVGLIPESLKPCTQGVPCSEKAIEWFGFVTIPTLSVAAFSIILACVVAVRSRRSE